MTYGYIISQSVFPVWWLLGLLVVFIRLSQKKKNNFLASEPLVFFGYSLMGPVGFIFVFINSELKEKMYLHWFKVIPIKHLPKYIHHKNDKVKKVVLTRLSYGKHG